SPRRACPRRPNLGRGQPAERKLFLCPTAAVRTWRPAGRSPSSAPAERQSRRRVADPRRSLGSKSPPPHLQAHRIEPGKRAAATPQLGGVDATIRPNRCHLIAPTAHFLVGLPLEEHMHLREFVFAAALALTACGGSSGNTTKFTATLNGASETPGGATAAPRTPTFTASGPMGNSTTTPPRLSGHATRRPIQ